MWGGQKGQLKVRDNHLVDEKTSRDLMGVSRGRCLGCSSCGKYIIYTKDKYYRKGEDAPLHPDCDPSIMNCSRCSCAADQHEIDVAATERENGNDAVAIGDYDSAIVHYSKALEVNPVDPKIWSNRSKCYCAKRWWSQALYDANRGVSLDPTWYKLHYRKAVALKGLGHLQEALGACTTALSCLEQSKDDSRDASRAIQQLIRDLNSRIGVQNSKHSESQKRNRPLQESDRKISENKGTVESKSTLTDYDGKAELECIRSSIERMQDQINFISEWISKHACPHAPREELIDIRNRLDKIESHLETSDCTEECVACGSDDEGDKAGDPTKASDGESISRTSSSMSDLSDTIAMIENAWKIKLDFQETISNATTDSDTRDCESPHKDSGDDKNSSSTSSSQESSDRTSQTLSEREKRVLRAKERREKAEKAGECMMTTSQDMLTQTKRMGCKICGPSCPEFKIYYQNEDVHDPEVMFYCSECGCRSEDHEIDQAYEKARQEKAEMEEQRARIRAARMRARNSEGFSKMQEAYATLGIQRGCSVDEIKSAYRALAKRYHPDKQKGRHIREQDIMYFTNASQMEETSSDSEGYIPFGTPVGGVGLSEHHNGDLIYEDSDNFIEEDESDDDELSEDEEQFRIHETMEGDRLPCEGTQLNTGKELAHVVENRQLNQRNAMSPRDSDSDVSTAALLGYRSLGIGGSPYSLSRKIATFDIIPDTASNVLDRMESRGYIGQFTADGERFIGAFQNERIIKIYDPLRNFKVVKSIQARNLRWTITDTAMSPDGRFILYSSITPLVHLVTMHTDDPGIESIANVTDIHETLTFSNRSFSEGLWSIKWSGDGKEIVAGSSEPFVYIYDIESQQIVSKLHHHQRDVNAVEYADETNRIFYSGSDDSFIHVWDRRLLGRSGKPVGSFIGHTEGLAHLNSKNNSCHLISNAKDQTIKCWDMRNMASWNEAKEEQKKTDVPTFRWDYRWMTYPGTGKRIRHPRDKSIATYRGHQVISTLIRSYWSPAHTTGQRYIYTGCGTGSIHIFDVVTGEKVRELEHHVDVVRDCSWHPYLPMLVSISFDGTVVSWEPSFH